MPRIFDSHAIPAIVKMEAKVRRIADAAKEQGRKMAAVPV